MEELRIDSHKLFYHPKAVSEWLEGKTIYPITVEVSPSGACNFRCIFCAFDYLGYATNFLSKELLLNTFQEMSSKGTRAIVLAGEGEPLLNPDLVEVISQRDSYCLDLSVVSNGLLFSKDFYQETLHQLRWVRFSVNAGTDHTHQKIHHSKPGDFQKIVKNIGEAVQWKDSQKLSTTIGIQLLMIPENSKEVISLAKIASELGVDYFTVKPYSQHPLSINKGVEAPFYEEFGEIHEELRSFETKDFHIAFREDSMKKKGKRKLYSRCLGLPFWAYIDAKANVWACISYVGDPRFLYGNLHESSFSQIWEGEQRKKVLDYVQSMDITPCRELCRLDQINEYLNELKFPSDHVNFI